MPPKPPEYIELRARSAFFFLEGASPPEDLIERASALDYPALALADRGGVYGIPRFHQAARRAGVRAILGAEIELAPHGQSGEPGTPLLLLVESSEGWRRLSRLLTLGHRGRDKSECRIGWNQLEENARGLTLLLRGDERLSPSVLDRAQSIFGQTPDRLWVDVSRHLDRNHEAMARRAVALAENARVPVVTNGDVRCAEPRGRALLDTLTYLR